MMKNYVLFLVFTLSTTVLIAQNKDEEAIKKVIEVEFDAFTKGDYNTWVGTYVDAPSTTFMVTPATTSGALFAVSDFQKISSMMKAGIKPPQPGTTPDMTLASRDNWLFRIKGDMAFAIYDEVFLLKNGVKVKAKTQKVMERIKGQWKIATTSAICDFNNAIIPTPNPEEEAIKKVIIDEMDAYLTSNVEAWANAQMQTPYHSTLHKFINVSSAVGWDKKYEGAKKNFGSPNDIAYKKSYDKVNRTDWNIQIRGNVAWARWKDMWDMTNGTKLPMYNLKILEKQNNQWRISHTGTYPAPEETFDKAKEEEAIKKVIVNETEMWLDQKHDAWAESFVHTPYLTWAVTNGGDPGDGLTKRSWDSLDVYMGAWFKNDMSALTKEWRKAKTVRDQWQIQIRSNVAFVSFNQHGESEKQKTNSTEERVLEKINGVWKIAMQATIMDFKDAIPPIRSKY